MHLRFTVLRMVVLLAVLVFVGGCVTPGGGLTIPDFGGGTIERTASSYEAEGKRWGERHWNSKPQRTPSANTLDDAFVEALIGPIDFFWVHSDLKDAFKKGYRLGYQDRTADLVLGPNLSAAATKIGEKIGNKFVNTIETFEAGWAESIRKAIDVFITLISEGSQSDREKFVAKFTDIYHAKYKKTKEILEKGAVVTQVSEGGTLLFLDYSQGKMLGALKIPDTDSLKTELYNQAFKVMGAELGRRFSSNLIKRDELVDLLRRSKTALQETPVDQSDINVRLRHNMKTIHDAFVKKESYGTDAENVFRGLIKDAGYSEDVLGTVRGGVPGKKR